VPQCAEKWKNGEKDNIFSCLSIQQELLWQAEWTEKEWNMHNNMAICAAGTD